MAGSSNKVALIAGVTGQDGAYLARFLLGKGYVNCCGIEGVSIKLFQSGGKRIGDR